MIPYRHVKSSWVEGFGVNSATGLLYVGTKGKYYEVSGLQAADVENLLAGFGGFRWIGLPQAAQADAVDCGDLDGAAEEGGGGAQ